MSRCLASLVFGWGNPGRGDDALGPALIGRLDALAPAHPEWGEVRLLTDFQLQPEHALDLEGCERVLFVDAGASCPAPFALERLASSREFGYTTHAMSPAALLALFRQVCGCEPPPAWLLGIHAASFELGAPLSETASRNLEAAVAFAGEWLSARH